MRRKWFGPKRIGYGVGPRSWEGWLTTAIFAGGLFALLKLVAPDISPLVGVSRAMLGLILGAVWVALYAFVVWMTYDADA